jgi:hypothetical protein
VNKKTLLKFAGLFLLAYVVLLGLSLQYGQHYVEFLLPLYRSEIGLFFPDFNIASLALITDRGEEVVALNLNLVRYTVLVGQVLHPGGSVSSSTLAGHALQHPLVMLSLLAALPVSNIQHRIALLFMAVPLLLLVEMLDVPMVLLGSIEDLILANVAPTADSFLVGWMNFMNGGGRLALSIVAALIAFGGGRILSSIWLHHEVKT